MPARTYYTYIISSRAKVLYIGMTNNLERRIQQHKEGKHDSFTREYRCHHLVLVRALCNSGILHRQRKAT